MFISMPVVRIKFCKHIIICIHIQNFSINQSLGMQKFALGLYNFVVQRFFPITHFLFSAKVFFIKINNINIVLESDTIIPQIFTFSLFIVLHNANHYLFLKCIVEKFVLLKISLHSSYMTAAIFKLL